MKVSFEYTKEEFKKYLFRSRLLNNIILFIIGIVIALLLFSKFLIYLPLIIIGLIILIYLINKLFIILYLKVNDMLNYNLYGKYTVELTPNKFSVTLNKSKNDYKYNKIKKIVERKNSFKIKFKNSREYLTFEKNKINEKDYNKLLEMFKEKI